MKNGYKEDIVVIIFIISFICAVIFMCTCRNDVSDNGHGIDNVRDELEHAQAAQREEARAIGRASEATHRSTEAISNSQRTTKEIKRMERKDAEIIDECEQILARVRKRTATENSQS